MKCFNSSLGIINVTKIDWDVFIDRVFQFLIRYYKLAVIDSFFAKAAVFQFLIRYYKSDEGVRKSRRDKRFNSSLGIINLLNWSVRL